MKIPLAEKLMFSRNLQVMIKAGVSLPQGLKILSEQAKSRRFRAILLAIAEKITKGQNLSGSLAVYPGVFSEFFVNMVRVGEEAGNLDEVLGNLSSQMEKEHELKARVRGAMIYPLIIILVMLGVGILMMIIIVPGLAATFEGLDVKLPVTTRAIIKLASFLSQKWYFFVLFFPTLAFILRVFSGTKRGGRLVSLLGVKMPIIAPIVKKTNAASFSRTLGVLIASGVPIVRSLKIVSRTLTNFYFRSALLEASGEVEKGKKLSESLKPHQTLFPALVFQMMEIGEETGQTVDILNKLADFYEEEVFRATQNLSSVIEPVLMLIIGGAVGFFAVSIIQPIYSLMGTL